MISRFLSICFLSFSLFVASLPSALAAVNYSIDLTKPTHHLASVTVTFPEYAGKKLRVNLPVWRTGRYQVLPLGDDIRLFEATDSEGKSLPWKRTASGEWLVTLTQPTQVSVSYQLYANRLGQRVSHIDETHAFLDASGAWVSSPEFRDQPLIVKLAVPQAWRSFSGMSKGGQEHSFVAPNYDILVDSPIETGINQHRKFEAHGKKYELVVWGEGNYDIDTIVEDLAKIGEQATAIWNDYPFERYVYMIHATSGARGATEHINSTIIQLPRFNFRAREDYIRFIRTASHEFIHTWNVKAYRPQGLVPYEYQHENMTSLLWVAEGSTSYFQSQLLLRAGIITPEEFFEDLAKRINNNEHNPGRTIQSIAQASTGQWVAAGGNYAINHSVNIYSEGYLTSWALDFSLLENTQLKSSYRDVHSQLYQNYRLPKGYTVADIQQILHELSGKDYKPWWEQNVVQPATFDFTHLLNQAGLEMTNGKDSKIKADLDITLAPDSLVLKTVERGGAAWKAGLVAKDELVAINGLKVTVAGFEKRLGDFQPADIIEVTVFRNDKLVTHQVTLNEAQTGKLAIVPVKQVTNQQKAFFKAWLGIDWPFA